jgi:hypothetical protein
MPSLRSRTVRHGRNMADDGIAMGHGGIARPGK